MPSLPRVLHCGQPLYISGSWDNFKSFEMMEGGRYGTYSCAVTLGDNRWEEFQISCNKGENEVFHPVFPRAGQDAQILGPDWAAKGKTWIIDGRTDGVPVGTIYHIEFNWTDEGKSLFWRPLDVTESTPELKVIGQKEEVKRQYYLFGTPTRWEKHKELKEIAEGYYETTFAMTYRREEEFQIICDKDDKQAIYPTSPLTKKATAPLCGPDWNGKGKHWLVKAPQHEVISVRLHVADGQASVTLCSPSLGERTWRGWDAWYGTHTFFAHFNHLEGLTPLRSDPAAPGFYSCQVKLDDRGQASVRVIVDEDNSMVMFPDSTGALRGPCAVASDAAYSGWTILGERFGTYDVRLDLRQGEISDRVFWQKSYSAAPLPALTS